MWKRIKQAIKIMWQEKSLKAGWKHFLEINILAGLDKAYQNHDSLAALPAIDLDAGASV